MFYTQESGFFSYNLQMSLLCLKFWIPARARLRTASLSDMIVTNA